MSNLTGVISHAFRNAVKRLEAALGLAAEDCPIPPGDWELLPYDFRVDWYTESRFTVTPARQVRLRDHDHDPE